MYACVLLVPRWYQLDQGISATGSGVRIYPLLIGLLLAVNLGAVAVARRGEVRGPLLVSGAVVLLGGVVFVMLDAGSPGWLPLVAMAVLGLGMGPALSGLQIAISRTVTPADLGAAMGILLLGRQVVGVVALAVGEALYDGRVDGHGPAAATGWAVAWVASAGAVVAALGIAGVRARLPGATTAGGAAAAEPSLRATASS